MKGEKGEDQVSSGEKEGGKPYHLYNMKGMPSTKARKDNTNLK